MIKIDRYEQTKSPTFPYESQNQYAMAEEIVASSEKQLDQNNAFSIVLWPSW